MTDSGPGDPVDPTRPPIPPATEQPEVVPPRFGDAPSAPFHPQYPGEPTAVPGSPPPGTPPPSYTDNPAAPGVGASAPVPMEARRDPWWQFAAPVLAGLVVVAGVAFLVVRGGGGDSGETLDTEPPATQASDTIADLDDPVIETTAPDVTVPAQTSPPLVGTTVPPDATTVPPATTAPVTTAAPSLPTQADLEASLVTAADVGPDWTEVPFVEDDICAADEDFSGTEIATATRSFDQTTGDGAFRSLSHVVTSYTDPAAAERAFTAELAAIEACSGTTIDIEGFDYDVLVLADSFSEEESAAFPCRDQNTSVIASFTNPDNTVPFIGQALIAFRCGVNVMAVSIASTIDIDDLNDQVFFDVAGAANVSASRLPGSS